MGLLTSAFDAMMGIQVELAIFFMALCTHLLLFGSHRWKPLPQKIKLGIIPHAENRENHLAVCGRLAAAVSPGATAVHSFTRAVRALLRQGTGTTAFVKLLKTHAPADQENLCPLLSTMLETLGHSVSVELLAAVRHVLQEQGMPPSPALAEAMLRGYLALRLPAEFEEVLTEVDAASEVNAAIAVLALRNALACSDLDAAAEYFHRFAAPLKASMAVTPSAAPHQLVQQLIKLAMERGVLPSLLRDLGCCGFLTALVVETALQECASKEKGSAAAINEVAEVARSEGVAFTESAFATMLHISSTAGAALHILAEATKCDCAGKAVLLAALEAAAAHRSSALSEAVRQCLPKNPTPDVAGALLCALSNGLTRGREADTAVLSTYEQYLMEVDVLVDAKAGRLVAEAALRRRRPDLLQQLLRATTESPRRVALLKSFGSESRLAEATAVFNACPEKSTCLYNSLLDSCIDCQDLEAAERIMAEAVAAGMADVVTYNTIIKKHLQRGHFERARAVIETMRSAGGNFAPNSVTFNELIDATVRSSTEGAWVLVDEMKACGLQPTSVTCSILLKSIQRSSKPSDVERTMSLMSELEDTMDEVLLSSICEACIRVGRADLLQQQLQKQRSSKGVQVTGAHTFGSIIRALGFLKDVSGAWEAWREMRTRHIMPTSITIGCMVEALVSNGDPEAGLELVRELAADKDTRPLLNAIAYCSVLKGFSHQKCFGRVWDVYGEMCELKLQFSIVTYNALIDACARGGEMARVQGLLEDMSRQKIEPNLVTYSTILKGYCQEGRLDKAFELLAAMKQSRHFRPDEIAYNTLIDGCAQRGLYEQGMKLLEEMQEADVPPSTFTLSVLVKLANRGKRPEKAFELVEELSRKYYLQPNVHVFDNLVHACTTHGDLRRALQVLERMVRQRVRPDARTYMLLIRHCLEADYLQEAAGLVRLACNLRGVTLPARLAGLAALDAGFLQLRGGLSSVLAKEVLEALVGRGGEERLAVQLCKDLRTVPGMRLDPKLSISLTSKAIRC